MTIADSLIEQELSLQTDLRFRRVQDLNRFYFDLDNREDGAQIQEKILKIARSMHLSVARNSPGNLSPSIGPVLTVRVPGRDKRIWYDAGLLPKIDAKNEYGASDIITGAMKVFARDRRVMSVYADLATTSGMEAGVAAVDQARALNAGVAEANMMCIGEAFAALGYNAWISTFCPFFDWKVLRRIAVGHQERLESWNLPPVG